MGSRLTRAALLLSALALSLPASGARGATVEESKNRIARFELFVDCLPMRLLVENLPADASKIGLTKEAIRAAAESRLRAARLYRSILSAPYHHLYINVNVVGQSHSIRLDFRKDVYDPLSGNTGFAITWNTSGAGTHGGSGANFILSTISQYMDEFLVEFLRVNEKACEKRFAPSGDR